MNYKADFPMLNKNLVYFDNAATTFKPWSVINKYNEYYTDYSCNAHRGQYNISYLVDEEIDTTREEVKRFINAKQKEEIIFTSGTTESINMIVSGFFRNELSKKDEIILSKSEHASNVMPWLLLKKTNEAVIKYIPLNEDGSLDISKLEDMITPKTKVISLAHITNVIGDKRNIKKVIEIAKKHDIYTVVDAAQSIGHIKTDVRDLDCDFLVFSAHKMCGPTGLGVLYGKYDLLNKTMPLILGGGMNEAFSDKKIILKNLPGRLEGGTQNISSITSFKEAIKYIEKVGFDNIEQKELYLKKYLERELQKIDYIKIHNEDTESGIIIFNVKDKYASDVALYLNSKNICVRAGTHCVKMLKEEAEFSNTIRISLYFYNSIDEINYLINVLKNKEELYSF